MTIKIPSKSHPNHHSQGRRVLPIRRTWILPTSLPRFVSSSVCLWRRGMFWKICGLVQKWGLLSPSFPQSGYFHAENDDYNHWMLFCPQTLKQNPCFWAPQLTGEVASSTASCSRGDRLYQRSHLAIARSKRWKDLQRLIFSWSYHEISTESIVQSIL